MAGDGFTGNLPDTLKFIDQEYKGDRYEGKRVMLVGGSSGICFATAAKMVQECAKTVYIVCRNTIQGDLAVNVLKELSNKQTHCASNSEILLIKADITDRTQVENVFDTVGKHNPRLDVLLNCAGISGYVGVGIGHVPAATLFSKFDPILNNLYGAVHVSSKALEFWNMSDDPESHDLDYTPVIINHASEEALQPCPGCDLYGASKAGIVILTNSIASLYSKKIRAHCIAPGLVDTPMTWNQVQGTEIAKNGSLIVKDNLQAYQCYNETDGSKILDGSCPGGGRGFGCPCPDVPRNDPRIPLKYGSHLWPPIDPKGIASISLFLASDDGDHLNGKTIVVDNNISASTHLHQVRDCPMSTVEMCPITNLTKNVSESERLSVVPSLPTFFHQLAQSHTFDPLSFIFGVLVTVFIFRLLQPKSRSAELRNLK